MSEELNFSACPVCGGDDITVISELGQRYVYCWLGCGLRLPIGGCGAHKNHADKWNHRAVPAGWKLVPVEPTEAMIGALSRALFEDDSYLYSDMAVNAYNVMILAAPDFKESAQ